MTLDEFAKAIEAALRAMQAEQMRIFEVAIASGLDPEILVGVMSSLLAKVEREAESGKG